MTRDELAAQVADYLHRTDLTAQILGFIDFATRRIGRTLRTPENQVIENLALSNPHTLPATFREMRRVWSDQSRGPIALQSLGLHAFTRISKQGTPGYYTISKDQLEITPFASGTFTLDYFVEPDELDTGPSTNAVLDAYPYLYLYASLIEASVFVQDEARAGALIGVYNTEIDQLNRQARKARAGDTPAMVGV